MTKAIAYYRVSTDLQKEEKTVEIQQNKVREFASKNGYELTGEFSDEGVSGGLRNRAGLKLMLDELQGNHEVKCVIIYKLDRLARDLYIQEGLIQEIGRLNKNIVSTLEPNLEGNDPFRKAFRQMLGIFSEFEKAMIALRLEGGRERRAQQGGWHGGQIYGYKNGDGKLRIDKEEAEAVKMMFDLRAKNYAYKRIAQELNAKRIVTKRGKDVWRISTVRKIINNPIYKGGLIRYKGNIYKSNIKSILN